MSSTIKQAIDGFLLSCKVEGKSWVTIDCYADKLKDFLWYATNYNWLMGHNNAAGLYRSLLRRVLANQVCYRANRLLINLDFQWHQQPSQHPPPTDDQI